LVMARTAARAITASAIAARTLVARVMGCLLHRHTAPRKGQRW
jgi:hypothetical protein